MSKATPKKYVWRVVTNTIKSLDVVAETEQDAIGLFYQYTEDAKIAKRVEDESCYDIEAYELDVKPTRKKRGLVL